MPRLSHDARKTALVTAALAVARRKGLGATTARDVAAEMGTSSGLIHHYFDSMDDLLAVAFASAAQSDLNNTREALLDLPGPLRRLQAYFKNYERIDGYWSMQLWLDAWAEAARRPPIGAISKQLNMQWQQILEQIIAEGVSTGAFRCADPDGAAWRLLSTVDGLALQVVAHGDMVSAASAVAWSLRSAELELGLAPGSL